MEQPQDVFHNPTVTLVIKKNNNKIKKTETPTKFKLFQDYIILQD